MRSLAWITATMIGFVAGGIALHSPGATGLGQYPFDWDLPAAVFGAVFGAVVGAFTGFLQTRPVGGPPARFIIAAVVAVAVAHARAAGAPATWGVSFAAAVSGAAAALAFAWAARWLDWRALSTIWSSAGSSVCRGALPRHRRCVESLENDLRTGPRAPEARRGRLPSATTARRPHRGLD